MPATITGPLNGNVKCRDPAASSGRARGLGAAVERLSNLLQGRNPDATTTVTWARLGDPAEPMHVLGAYVDGQLKGIVHYLFHRSS
jgi:hypothetical protein